MIALILAAGKGNRISEVAQGEPKSFLLLGDKRIIDHQLDAIKQINVSSTVIVTGYQNQLFERDYGADSVMLEKNPFFGRSNVLASVWFARHHLRRGFFFMHADTYYDPSIIKDLENHHGDLVLCVQHKATVPEDMKVNVTDGRVWEINKGMDCADAYGEFTGLLKVSERIADDTVRCISEFIEYDGRLDDFFEVVIQALIDRGITASVLDIGDRVSIEIDFPEDYERAQQLYAEHTKRLSS